MRADTHDGLVGNLSSFSEYPSWREISHQRISMRDMQKGGKISHQSLMDGCPHAKPPYGGDAFPLAKNAPNSIPFHSPPIQFLRKAHEMLIYPGFYPCLTMLVMLVTLYQPRCQYVRDVGIQVDSKLRP